MYWPELSRRICRVLLYLIGGWCLAFLFMQQTSPPNVLCSLGIMLVVAVAGLACSCRPIEESASTDRATREK